MTAEKMTASVQQYIDGLNAGNVDNILALYDANASLEDPVGSTAQKGADALRAFYQRATQMKVQVKLTGPVRCAGNSAAFSFALNVVMDKQKMLIDVIDVFEFNAQGKVQSMKAYWGPENCKTV